CCLPYNSLPGVRRDFGKRRCHPKDRGIGTVYCTQVTAAMPRGEHGQVVRLSAADAGVAGDSRAGPGGRTLAGLCLLRGGSPDELRVAIPGTSLGPAGAWRTRRRRGPAAENRARRSDPGARSAEAAAGLRELELGVPRHVLAGGSGLVARRRQAPDRLALGG